MGKYNIDDILNDLGMGDEGGADPRKKRHRIDTAESSFSPLPSVPANQPDGPKRTDDPAVPVPPIDAPNNTVGNTLSDI